MKYFEKNDKNAVPYTIVGPSKTTFTEVSKWITSPT